VSILFEMEARLRREGSEGGGDGFAAGKKKGRG